MTKLQSKIETMKLQTTERHMKALAEELTEIDRLTCPRCSDSIMDEIRLLGDELVVYEERSCPSCGYEESEGNS